MTTPTFTGYELLIGVFVSITLTSALLTFIFEWYSHAKRLESLKDSLERAKHKNKKEEEEVWF